MHILYSNAFIWIPGENCGWTHPTLLMWSPQVGGREQGKSLFLINPYVVAYYNRYGKCCNLQEQIKKDVKGKGKQFFSLLSGCLPTLGYLWTGPDASDPPAAGSALYIPGGPCCGLPSSHPAPTLHMPEYGGLWRVALTAKSLTLSTEQR